MTTETGTFTPTDEDVEHMAAFIRADTHTDLEAVAQAILATIGPIIERERRAAYEEGFADGAAKPPAVLLDHCHAGRDGECRWEQCPQVRDGEPAATGRHCPIDVREDGE